MHAHNDHVRKKARSDAGACLKKTVVWRGGCGVWWADMQSMKRTHLAKLRFKFAMLGMQLGIDTMLNLPPLIFGELVSRKFLVHLFHHTPHFSIVIHLPLHYLQRAHNSQPAHSYEQRINAPHQTYNVIVK
jgi:hypothetical protein